MTTHQLPCLFHPTTTLLIDDDQRFLNSSTLKLGKQFLIQSYADPEKAVAHLKQQQQKDAAHDEKVFCYSEGEHLAQLTINVDIPAIHKGIYEGNSRFERISTVIVDYAMTTMNGLEFCSQFINSNCKKILLTGEADHQIAVKAFNDGIIDKFFLKASSDSDENLIASLKELQEKYFLDLSAMILKSLTSTHAFLEPKFNALLREIFTKHNIKEYYLLDETGSMLLLNSQAKPIWLIVKDQQEIESLYELAEDDPDLDPKLLNALHTGKKLPFIITENDRLASANQWQFYPANQLANTNIFYVLLTDAKHPAFNMNTVKSYDNYLHSL